MTTLARNRPTKALAWGYNNRGGLGTAGSARALHPVPVELPADTIDVQGGTDFSVALTSAGHIWTWGGNDWGQLGELSIKHRLKPGRVTLPSDPYVTAIAVGQDHVIALAKNGRVFGWGRDHHGQIGTGTRADRRRPVAVGAAGSPTITQIAAGNQCSFAVTTSGAVLAWGAAAPFGGAVPAGGLDVSVAGVKNALTPQRLLLANGARAAMVDAGLRHTVVLTNDGHLLNLGQLITGRPTTQHLVRDRSWGKVVSISAGDNHTVALTSSGTVLTWGANNVGQLANRTTINRDAPVAVRIQKLHGRVVQAIAGGDSTWIRTDTDHVYSWGSGQFGQHGSGTTDDLTRPAPVQLDRNVTAERHHRISGLYVGRAHCFAFTI